MKLKKTILGLAVVAVAGVNAWLANDVRLAKNELSLVNLENVADASEQTGEGDAGKGEKVESWPSEDFSNEWIYIDGRKTKARGNRVWHEVDCEGQNPSDCQPKWEFAYYVLH